MATGVLTANMSVKKAIETYRARAEKLREKAAAYEKKAVVYEKRANILEADLKVDDSVEEDKPAEGKLTIGGAAREILRQAGKPLHGVRDIYPQLVQRGIKTNKNGLQTILGRTPNIRKVDGSPNTWAYEGNGR